MTGLEVLILSIVGVGFLFVVGFPAALLGIGFLRLGRPSGKITGYKARQNQVKGLYPPEVTGKAFDLFKESWSEVFGSLPSRMDRILDAVDVHWTEDVIKFDRPYTVNGKTYSIGSGITDSRISIRVWIRDYNIVRDENGKMLKDKNGEWVKEPREPLISRTALGHELIHIVLWNTTGEPDPDHEGDEYKGWGPKHTQVERLVSQKLQQAGF